MRVISVCSCMIAALEDLQPLYLEADWFTAGKQANRDQCVQQQTWAVLLCCCCMFRISMFYP